jgi:hypothetical protein
LTEYGAIKELSIEYPGEYQKQREAKNIAIRAIKEVLEYRKLGTLEELQEANGKRVIKIEKCKCIKGFYIPKYEEGGIPYDDYMMIRRGDIFEYVEGCIGESDIRLYLEDGDYDDYLDMTRENFEEYFERIE